MQLTPPTEAPDPARLEVLRQLFTAVAEEMGAALRRSALSPNIKERRDYSCAVFDAGGRPVAMGDHMPVHLGAMPASVQAALARHPEPAAGDVLILNDPFEGGTHLPDITLVAPVHLEGASSPVAFVAARAHHADVGGMTPGSMPLATEIHQEGLRIPPMHLVRQGRRVSQVWTMIRANVRTPDEREGDLEAQLAALHRGRLRVEELARRSDDLAADMAAVLAHAHRTLRAGIRAIPDGVYRGEDHLEDDGFGGGPFPIRVALRISGDELVADFTGSAPTARGGINAVGAITASALRHVLRCVVEDLLGTPLPAGGGAMEGVRLVLPENSVVNAAPPAAVAAGNVEASQRITDVLLLALGGALPDRMPALSQGTMNNLTLGGRRPPDDPRAPGAPFTWYETMGGGMGAGPDGPGLSGVHVHMSNTLNTPVEALENEIPVQVEAYRIRRGSGGTGRHRGGEGLERVLRPLVPVTVTLLAERRTRGPRGVRGGEAGAPGSAHLEPAGGGPPETLPAKVTFEAAPHSLLTVRSPGGGGWGPPSN